MQSKNLTRLTIRPLQLSDAAFIISLVNSPGWLKYIGDRNIHDTPSAEEYIQKQIKGYAEFSLGLRLVFISETNTAIGICGFLKRDELPLRDIGYALLAEFEGQGYASEMIQMTLATYWRAYPQTPALAQVQKDNTRSIRLLQKLGFNKNSSEDPTSNTVIFRREAD